ncbi:MAG: DeoR/GlpR family DNA-binding transcription regulator [Clostridiales bacterium]|nr:DeoR/GlpR family DNA-binding transcription regulator [Clostridiales bacterium]
MNYDQRKAYILNSIRSKDYILVNNLIEEMNASPATIRRDLVKMESEGVIRRSRGKIFLHNQIKVPKFFLRQSMQDDEKSLIGKKATELIEEGDTIIIDSGTTTLAFAYQLRDFHMLTVLTNSIPVAYVLGDTEIDTYVCGGFQEDMALVDESAVSYFENRRVKKAFLGASGVNGEIGLSVTSSLQMPVKKKMAEAADKVYVLLDSSKFNITGISTFLDFSDIDGIVTSKKIQNQKLLDRLDQLGVAVYYSEG